MEAAEWLARCLAGSLPSVNKLTDEELQHERAIAKNATFAERYGSCTVCSDEQSPTMRRFRALHSELFTRRNK